MISRLESFFYCYRKVIPYLVLVTSLVVSSLLRWYFVSHLSSHFFGLSFTDIANTHPRFMGSSSRLPYINFDFEYPVVLAAFFYMTGFFGAAKLSVFYFLNSFLLSSFALLSFYLMGKIHKLTSEGEYLKRSLIFWAVSPSVFLFTTYNWEMLAVLLMLLALFLVLKGRNYLAMVFLCLGAFTKMFPGFLLLPFLVFIAKRFSLRKAALALAVFVFVALAINLPIILYRFSSWSYFFKFSAARGAFGDNIWAIFFVLRDKFGLWQGANLTSWVSFGSLGVFAASYLLVNWFYFRSKRDVFLQTCFLSILAFLVTAKTTSAPFSLWVLPFFILLPVNIWVALLAEWSNAFTYYAFFQHIYYNNFLSLSIAPGHYFRLTYIGVVARELSLLVAGFNYMMKLGWIKIRKLPMPNA